MVFNLASLRLHYFYNYLISYTKAYKKINRKKDILNILSSNSNAITLLINRSTKNVWKQICFVYKLQNSITDMMDQQILGAEQDFQMSTENASTDPKQRYFNQVVMCLQEVILDEEFQETQTLFMKENCNVETKSLGDLQQLFKQYRTTISQLLNQKIKMQLPDFELASFAGELKQRIGQVDEEIAEIVFSCFQIESFKAMLQDYKVAQQEEQRYRVLTVKTNKLPENKKVKGNTENIFGSSNVPSFGPKTQTKKVSPKGNEKTLDQLLVPETILTVKGLRKG